MIWRVRAEPVAGQTLGKLFTTRKQAVQQQIDEYGWLAAVLEVTQ
jgi:hypothetical protein